ncbi:hypothetical protein [Nonomuraea rubra]|uniref:hypothetical protein n=1 Tax=Nonomuraea rubra TaxID=46180 RepID=UPI0033E20B8E
MPFVIAEVTGWTPATPIPEPKSFWEQASWIAGILGPPLAIIIYVLENRRRASQREKAEGWRGALP